MEPPTVMPTASATIENTGAKSIKAAAHTITSIARFRKPGNPVMDLCRLTLCLAGFGCAADPLFDELSDLCLECFTRKCLHLAQHPLSRPRHRFKSTHRTHNVIRVLFCEKNSVHPILNRF